MSLELEIRDLLQTYLPSLPGQLTWQYWFQMHLYHRQQIFHKINREISTVPNRYRRYHEMARKSSSLSELLSKEYDLRQKLISLSTDEVMQSINSFYELPAVVVDPVIVNAVNQRTKHQFRGFQTRHYLNNEIFFIEVFQEDKGLYLASSYKLIWASRPGHYVLADPCPINETTSATMESAFNLCLRDTYFFRIEYAHRI